MRPTKQISRQSLKDHGVFESQSCNHFIIGVAGVDARLVMAIVELFQILEESERDERPFFINDGYITRRTHISLQLRDAVLADQLATFTVTVRSLIHGDLFAGHALD